MILDVVLNHSAEIDLEGPTFSLRGIDNRNYYWIRGRRGLLQLDRLRKYAQSQPAGRGGSMPASNLRFWVDEVATSVAFALI